MDWEPTEFKLEHDLSLYGGFNTWNLTNGSLWRAATRCDPNSPLHSATSHSHKIINSLPEPSESSFRTATSHVLNCRMFKGIPGWKKVLGRLKQEKQGIILTHTKKVQDWVLKNL